MKIDQKQKILIIDVWSKSQDLVSEIVKVRDNKEIEFLFVHLGSYGEDLEFGKKEKQIAHNFKIRDIGFYNGKKIKEVLLLEKPIEVIFFSLDTLMLRSVYFIASGLGISTTLIAHGVHSLHGRLSVGGSNQTTVASRFKFLTMNIKRYVCHLLPQLISGILIAKMTCGELQDLYLELIGRVKGHSASVVNLSRLNKAIVLINRDRLFFQQKYRVSAEKISVALPQDFVLNLEPFSPSNFNFDKPHAFYIEAGYSGLGWVFKSEIEYAEFIIQSTKSISTLAGFFYMKIKPYPVQRFDQLSDLLRSSDIKVHDEMQSVIKRLATCQPLIISEPSTLTLYFMSLGYPIIWNDVEPFGKDLYSDWLLTYPRSKLLSEFQVNCSGDVRALFAEDQVVNQWIEFNLHFKNKFRYKEAWAEAFDDNKI
jgi:hypothetical protein